MSRLVVKKGKKQIYSQLLNIFDSIFTLDPKNRINLTLMGIFIQNAQNCIEIIYNLHTIHY